MTLKACCYNIFSVIKRQLWLYASWFVVLFFYLPVQTALMLQRLRGSYFLRITEYHASAAEDLLSVFGLNMGLTWILMFMAFCSALVFGGYMHRQKQVDFYHSQPISRTWLLLQNALAGLLALLLPYVANLLLMLVVALAMGAGGAFPWGAFFSCLAIHTLYFTAIFVTVLIAVVISGKGTVAGITGIFFLSLLPALLGLALTAAGEFYPTFYSSLYDWGLIVRWLSPAAAYVALALGGPPYGILPVIVYNALAVTAAILLYRKRGSEAAGQAIAFKAARSPLKYAMACLAATVFAIVFHSIGGYGEYNYFWWYFGAVAGGFLATQITEIVYALDFRAVFRNLRGLAIFLVVFLGLSTCAIHDIGGFNAKVPEAEQVASARIHLPGVNDHVYHGWGYMYGYFAPRGKEQSLERNEWDHLSKGPVTSPAAIAAAVNIAARYANNYLPAEQQQPQVSEAQIEVWRQEGKQYLLDYPGVVKDASRPPYEYINLANTSCKVVFTLKNGRTVAREYGNIYIPVQFLLEDISVIYAEEDFRAAQLRELMLADEYYMPESLELFELYYSLPDLTWMSSNDRSGLLAALRADTLGLTVEEQRQAMPIGALHLRLYGGPIEYPLEKDWLAESRRPYRVQEWPIYASFERTLAFLAKAGYGQDLWQPHLEDIVSVSLTTGFNDRYPDKYFYEPAMTEPAFYGAYNEKTQNIPGQLQREENTAPDDIAKTMYQSYPSGAARYNRFIDIDYREEAEVRYMGPGGIIYTTTRVFPY